MRDRNSKAQFGCNVALMAGLLALTFPADHASAQTIQTTSLTPSLPVGSTDFLEFRLTVGDIDGDGVPDLLFTNSVAFARVYFMTIQSVPNTALVQDPQKAAVDIFAYNPASCPTDTRLRSRKRAILDNPLIYDIDLDGFNEVIYIDYIPPNSQPGTNIGDLMLQVWDYDAANHTMIRKFAPPTNPNDRISGLINNYLGVGGYYNADCNTQTPILSKYFALSIGNVRGRAIPQDILVVAQPLITNKACTVFAYSGSQPAPSLTRIMSVPTNSSAVPPEMRSDGGHNFYSYDLNYDGFEEVVGNIVAEYSPHTLAPLGTRLLWAPRLTTSGTATDSHADHFAVADFCESIMTSHGLMPSPGLEVVLAPQTQGASPVDKSGPWLIRAASGPDLTQVTCGYGVFRKWPYRVINRDQGLDGCLYEYPSTASWSQPNHASAPANWAMLGNALFGGFQSFDANVQAVFVGDFSIENPGLELACCLKQRLVGGGSLWLGHGFSIFGSTPNVPVLDFGETTTTAWNGPTIWGPKLVDFSGARLPLEFHSFGGYPTNTLAHMVSAFSGTSAPLATSVVAWDSGQLQPSSPQNNNFGAADGSYAFDVFGDSREEILLWREVSPQLVTLADSQGGVSRTDPSPTRYLEYRRRRTGSGVSYGSSIPYGTFSGLRLVTSALPIGDVGVPYGVAQDPAVLGGQTAAVILAEGGQPPYVWSVTQSGDPLPPGMTSSTVPISALGFASGLAIQGFTLLPGHYRVGVRVQDAQGAVAQRDYWIRIRPQPQQEDVGPHPTILGGGFGTGFVSANQPFVLSMRARVADGSLGSICIGVFAFDQLLGYLGVLSRVGTTDEFALDLPLPGLPAGLRTSITYVALSSSGYQSPPWPSLTVPGAPATNSPSLGDTSQLANQNAGNTPVIARVDTPVPAERLLAAETIERGGTHSLLVTIDIPDGQTVSQVEGQILSNIPGVQPVAADGGLQSDGRFALTFQVPAGWAGWGNYAVRVRATTTDGIGTARQSDWWPQIVVH